MSSTDNLLELPASTVACDLVRRRLEDAANALSRVSDRHDTEALHDFRVALRRLRGLLRAYRDGLGEAASRKLRRRLRKLGATTNAARDAEVQLEWLEQARATLLRRERSGLNWLTRRLRAARNADYLDVRSRVREEFTSLHDELQSRLGDVDTSSPSLATTLAALLREQASTFAGSLAAVRTPGDRRAIHEARISAKKLRYLLEPVRAEAPDAKPVVRSFKEFQDLFGTLHDMHVLEATLETALDAASRDKAARLRDLALRGERSLFERERRRDERLGLTALAARARTCRDQLFHDAERVWLSRRATELVRDVRAFADSIDVLQRARDEALATEIERKYLLLAVPERARSAPSSTIVQGWLPGKTLRERLRKITDDAGERYYRTVKLGSGVERIEIEEETTREVFETMWPLTTGCRISKRRYNVPDGDVVWEIDEFDDRDLVLAEVELAAKDQQVEIPEWLSASVAREVTDEPAYLNLSLATQAA